MKKIVVILFVFCVFFISIVNVYAYDTLNYKIDIPDKFVKDVKKDLWTLEEKDNIITVYIQVIENTSNIDINNMNSESLDKSLLKELNKSLNNIEDIKIKTSNLSLKKLNNYNSIKIDVDSSLTDDEFVSTIYQTQYIFSSEKYLYYLVFSSSNNSLLETQDICQIINSFTIKDNLKIENQEELKKYYITLSAIVLSGVIIMVVVKKK